ncbi:metallophosphoesterase [Halocatena halophila]|uniref:metallophosphoesterase n=1 Tax=Halocatena halophila TaxID=2814576 RepID=UPI002ED052BC
MAAVEPIPGAPVAVVTTANVRLLVLADYHAGIELRFKQNGVEIPSRADERRETVCSLLDRTNASRLVIVGDLATDIGRPSATERDEIERLFEAVAGTVPITIVKGNHDGDLETLVDEVKFEHDISVTDSDGWRFGAVGFVHGHTWPAEDVLDASILVMGHEHPMVNLTDAVGGGSTERVWLRGALDPTPFEPHTSSQLLDPGSLVVCPAFNDLTGGTWINTSQTFLAPFLPDGINDGQAYLLNGTRLGPYGNI